MTHSFKFVAATAVILFSLVSFGCCNHGASAPQPFTQSAGCSTCDGGGQVVQGGQGFAQPQYAQPQYASPQFAAPGVSAGSGTVSAPQSFGGGFSGGSGSR